MSTQQLKNTLIPRFRPTRNDNLGKYTQQSGWGILKGGAFARSAPLSRFLWLLSCTAQESNTLFRNENAKILPMKWS